MSIITLMKEPAKALQLPRQVDHQVISCSDST